MSFIKNKSKGLFDMDNRRNIEEIEKYQEQIKELFKESVSEECFKTWEDTFEIEEVDDKKVTVTYHGTQSIGEFKKECKETLISCIYSVTGDGKKIKISN